MLLNVASSVINDITAALFYIDNRRNVFYTSQLLMGVCLFPQDVTLQPCYAILKPSLKLELNLIFIAGQFDPVIMVRKIFCFKMDHMFNYKVYSVSYTQT